MKISDIVSLLDLSVFTSQAALDRPASGGYAGDLLSDVMAHGRKDDVWLTIQVHPNIVAVAVLKELAGIILVNGREPAAETVKQADQERISLLGTRLSAFELAGRLHGLGLKGA